MKQIITDTLFEMQSRAVQTEYCASVTRADMDALLNHYAALKAVNVKLRINEGLLKSAVTKTLDDNEHLADGDICTLIDLKRVLAEIGEPWGFKTTA